MRHRLFAAVALSLISSLPSRAIDISPSGSVSVDFTAGPVASDWKRGDIPGLSGDVTSVGTMDSKVNNPGSVNYIVVSNAAYANAINFAYHNRTLFSTPANVAAASLRAAVTNRTGGAIAGVRVNYTLCIPFNNSSVSESPRGFVVYYTTNATGTNGWINVGNHALATDAAFGKSNVTFTVAPAGGLANNAPVYFLWADDNAGGNDACYAVSNFTFSALSAGVSISSPASGTVSPVGAPLAIQAATNGVGGVTSVVFHADGGRLGDDVAAPYAFTWSLPAPGAHSLTAVALLDSGLAVTSAPVAVSVMGFTAYNDCVYSGAGNDLANAPHVSRFATNTASYPSTGNLTNQDTGGVLPVTVTLTGYGNNSFSTGAGTNCFPGTDAAILFGGKAGLRGNQGLQAGVADACVELVFSNLNPNATYTFAATANRGGTNAAFGVSVAPEAANRWTAYSISGVAWCTNASSAGVNVILDTPTHGAVSFCTGENTVNGFVARWGAIRGAADGTFRVKAGNEGLNGHMTTNCYGFGAFLLKEEPYSLTVSVAEPANGAGAAEGSNLVLRAAVSGSVTNVAFYANEVKLGDAVYPYAWAWTNLPFGAHALKAVATDLAGAAATSAVVNVTVTGAGALWFDGANDYVTLGQAPALGASNFTLECWMRIDGAGAGASSGSGGVTVRPLISKGRGEGETTVTNCNYLFGVLADNRLAADFEDMNNGLNHPISGTAALSTGVWHHCAVTYDGSWWRLYLDGKPDHSAQVTGGGNVQVPRFDSIQHAALGTALNTAGTPEGYFKGPIDEARIWNIARSAAQIAADYTNAVASAPGLIGRWTLDDAAGLTASNSVPGSPAGTLVNGPLWCNGRPAPVAGAIPPAVAVSAPAANAAFTVGSSATVSAAVSDADGSVTGVAFFADGALIGADASEPFSVSWTPAAAGRVALTAVAADNDGNTNGSAAVTVLAYAPGQVALQFDGTDDYATFGQATASLGASTFTLECWMRKTGTGATAGSGSGGVTAVPLIAKGVGESDGSDVDCNYFFGIQGSGALAADFEQYAAAGGGPAGQNYPVFGASSAPGDGAWHHVAATYDGSNWALYVDGSLDAATNVGLHTPRYDSRQHAGLAAALNSTGTRNGAFAGLLDEVRIWNYARSAAQIAANRTNAIPAAPGLLGRWSLDDATGAAAANTVAGSPAGALMNGPVWDVGRALGAPAPAAPAVALTAPPSGATVTAGDVVSLAALVTDDDATAGVDFVLDGASQGTDATAPYGLAWTAAGAGPHAWRAVATDVTGLAGTSEAVVVTVLAANLPPSVTAAMPTNGTPNAPTNAMLRATVTDPEGSGLTVSFYGRPAGAAAEPGPDFTIAVLPDTQYYSESYPHIFTNQTRWIAANRTNWNIVYVAHLGDITDDADSQPYQWTNAAAAMVLLEDPVLTGLPDGIPYGVTPGNHDHVGGTAGFEQFFGVSHFSGKPWYGGHLGADNLSHFDRISASGLDFVIVHTDWNYDALTYPPINAWANGVLQSNANRRAIVVRHAIVESSGAWSANGQALFDTVKTNDNVFLMLNGHSAGEFQRIESVNGRSIDLHCVDYQNLTNGGSGYLRLYQFSPSNNVIRVRTYSTTLNEYQTDANSQFNVPYAMGGAVAPYQLLGVSNNVPSGSEVALAWPGLITHATYEWYAVASDGTNQTTGSVASFTTAGAPPPPVTVTVTNRPYVGVTLLERASTQPRPLKITVADIDLDTPGLRFRLTPPSGRLETTTQTTLSFLTNQNAQLAINVHFFAPYPMTNLDNAATLTGIAASDGHVFSGFEESPLLAYAIRTNAPGLNIDEYNRASLVHRGASATLVREDVTLWNTLSGSEHILSNGVVVAQNNAWNNTLNPRTAIALASGNRLLLVTVDGRQPGVSEGMTVGELAAMLAADYGATEALNLDGGGSATMAVDQPSPRVLNQPSDSPARSVGSSLAVFAVSTNWMAAHGLTNYDADYTAVAPGGSVPAWKAYWMGAAPNDASAVLRITAVAPAPGGAGVTFPAAASRVYTLQYRDSLTEGGWTTVTTQARVRGTGGDLTLTDPAPAAGARFYRILVDLP